MFTDVQTLVQKTMANMQEYLREIKFSPGSMKNLQTMWEKLTDYAVSKGYTAFTEDWVFAFIKSYIEAIGKPVGYQRMRQYNRAGEMLCEFEMYGRVKRITGLRRMISDPALYRPIYDAVDRYAEKNQLKPDTIETYKNEANKLVLFLEANGIMLEELTFDLMREYLNSLSYLKQGSIANAHVILRSILQILYDGGAIKYDVSALCENINVPRNRNIPSTLTPEEIEKVLATVDRANATGKRDYAMLLLAARLGMRIGDIRTLKFKAIDWNRCEIRIVQEKTKKEVAFPLSEEIGFAIIDYVKSGRPESDSPNIFVKHVHPYNEFASANNFSDMLGKYLQKAGVHVPHGKPRGMHTLRHSLASNLLAEGTALPVVSEILGHKKTDTTMIYLKVDISQLRRCSLNAEFGGASS